MPKVSKKIATCFISYCHDDADHNSITAFEEQVKVCAGPSFRVIRDKSNINPAGGSIDQHESEIENSDVIIVLFTPKYREKVLNRSGGVYREFTKIMHKFNTYQSDLKSNKSVRTFSFIPILFSGSGETSYLPEISDRLYRDFTSFRATPRVSNHTLSMFRDELNILNAEFSNVLNGLTSEFASEYDNLLNLLFLESRHEELRNTFKIDDVDELLEELFVKTKSYEAVAARRSCILVGRKGSGKSTIVDHLHRNSDSVYKPPIRVIVDNFDLSYLYSFIFDHTNSSDIISVAKLENYFEVVWTCLIYKEFVRTIVDEEQNGKSLVDLSDYLPNLSKAYPTTEKKWSTFVEICDGVRMEIDRAIEKAKADSSFLASVSGMVAFDALVEAYFGASNLEALKGAISCCRRRFVFALDGFDQRFEDFRVHNLRSSSDLDEKKKRLAFEIAWLRGLLRATLRLRSGDQISQDKCDFCITIPQDRFMEVRVDEREDFRFRTTKSDVQWTAIELSILVRKRLEGLVFDFETDKELRPLDRLDEVLSSDAHQIPLKVQMRNLGNVNVMSTFKYILRHTFWRPRDVMYYVASILVNQRIARKRNAEVDETVVREIVSRTTYEVIETEFIKEFQNVFHNIREVLHSFEGAKIVLSFEEIESRLRGVDFVLSHDDDDVKGILGKVEFLYQIGFLGIVLDDLHVREDSACKDSFVFSDGDQKFRSMSPDKKKSSEYTIHPVFSEYLMLDSRVGRTVCYYSDEYLAKNDLLH